MYCIISMAFCFIGLAILIMIAMYEAGKCKCLDDIKFRALVLKKMRREKNGEIVCDDREWDCIINGIKEKKDEKKDKQV